MSAGLSAPSFILLTGWNVPVLAYHSRPRVATVFGNPTYNFVLEQLNAAEPPLLVSDTYIEATFVAGILHRFVLASHYFHSC